MRKIYLVVLLLVVFCVVDSDGTSVVEMFNNFPQDVSNAFTNAWHNIKNAIRKPVRIKRLGRGRRRKTTTTRSNTSASTIAPSAPTTTVTVLTSSYTTSSPRPYEFRRLEIPVLPTPLWRSLNDWRDLQKPLFAFKSDASRTPGIAMIRGLFNMTHDPAINLTTFPW